MKILGKFTARTLIHFGALEMSFVILLCYVLAVANHHVKPWLPTISDCGEHPPEQYPFRFGIMVGAMLLLVEAISLHAAKMSSTLTYVLGTIASLCLGVVAVVASNENNTVHSVAAVTFFVFEDIMNILLTMDIAQRISRISLGIKIISTTVAVISTTIKLLIEYNNNCPFLRSLETSNFPLLPVIEWSNTAAIIVFQLSLSGDVHDLWLAVVDIIKPSTDASPKAKVAATTNFVVDSPAPPLPLKSGLPLNPLPTNKEVIMYLEKVDS